MAVERLSWHRVGQKVVCVRRDWFNPKKFDLPVYGETYTVRAVERRFCGSLRSLLKEIVNSYYDFAEDGFCEQNFSAESFRPIRETSLDCFRHLLNPTPDQVREMEDAHV